MCIVISFGNWYEFSNTYKLYAILKVPVPQTRILKIGSRIIEPHSYSGWYSDWKWTFHHAHCCELALWSSVRFPLLQNPHASLLARWIGELRLSRHMLNIYSIELNRWMYEKRPFCVYLWKKGKVNPSVSLSLLSQSTLPVYDIAFVRKMSNGIVLSFKLGRECQCELRWNIWHESQMTISASNKQVPQFSSW